MTAGRIPHFLTQNFYVMSKNKITTEQNQSNMQNPNKGTSGTNKQYDQNQGNRGTQMNPNQTNQGKGDTTKKSS